MVNEEIIINDRKERANMINRIEVLEKVKGLLLLGDSEFATTLQVADYYEVKLRAITSLVFDNREELESNGLVTYKGKDLCNSHVISFKEFTKNRANYKFKLNNNEELSVGGRGVQLFSKRAILNVGMLLRDSVIAKEVRRRLLDIEYESNKSIQENGQTLKENIVEEIRTEQQIQKELIEAMMSGNYVRKSELKTELIGMKNKRIAELETTNKIITENAITIKETRMVINKIIRSIANRRYHDKINYCWDHAYNMLLYKHNISVKRRERKKNEYLIDTLNDTELKQFETMLRNWYIELGYDLESLLVM